MQPDPIGLTPRLAGGDLRFQASLPERAMSPVDLAPIGTGPAEPTSPSRRRARSLAPLVLMKHGGDLPPLFVIAGLGGVAIELFKFGRLVTYQGAIYASEFRGVDGLEAPDRRVSAIAHYQLAALRRVQPRGPYHLMGYSFGGLVAFEVARLLLAAGERVRFLALFEPAIHERWWPLRVRVRFAARRLGEHLATLRQTPLGDSLSYMSDHARPLLARMTRLLGGRADMATTHAHDGLPQSLIEVRRASAEAMYCYRIDPLDCHVTFFRSEIGNRLSCDSVELFAPYITSHNVRAVSGDHFSILRSPHVEDLARQVDLALGALET